jgi:oxygen-independent coproporphyrinogen III oxidase
VVIPGQVDLTEPYLRRLEAEAEMVAQRLGERRRVVQYHWGGGTPTHHTPKRLQALQQRILEHFSLDPDAEVAIEVDPRVTSVEHLETLRGLGFNRLSLGVQDLDPDVQRLIGRHQTEQQTETLYRTARELGFSSINFDLIYGLPGQTLDTLRATLEKVVGMLPDRLAVYSFAYVPWMRPHQRRIDPETLPETAAKFALLAEVVETLREAGYRHIGIDHFAVPDDDLVAAADAGTLTRTFMGYTTKRGTETVALGTSGISDIEGVYIQNHRRLASYFEAIDERLLPTERGYRLDHDDRLRRSVISELMCNARVDLAAIGEEYGVDPAAYFAPELDSLTAPGGLIEEGLARLDDLSLEASDRGHMFLRRLAMEFDTYLSRKDRPAFSRIV